jgi:N-methylhydantoinase B
MNGTEASAMAAGVIPFLYYIDPDIPHNHGCVEQIDVVAPEGTIVRARYPASTSCATFVPADMMQDVVNKALAQAIPERVPAGSTRCCNTPFLAGTTDGRQWGLALNNSAGGGGAAHGTDGWPLYYNLAALGGMKILSIEQLELLYPLRVEHVEIAPDSMGLGQWIGGPGLFVAVRPLGTDMTVITAGDGAANPPHGVLGGTPGIGGGQYVEPLGGGPRRFFSVSGSMHVAETERWVGISTGGGGYGHPCDRAVEQVVRDVRNGLVTAGTAYEVFGVALTQDGVVDEDATNDRRAWLRATPRPSVDPMTPDAARWLAENLRPGDTYELNPTLTGGPIA